jgi:hypothetical protein
MQYHMQASYSQWRQAKTDREKSMAKLEGIINSENGLYKRAMTCLQWCEKEYQSRLLQ